MSNKNIIVLIFPFDRAVFGPDLARYFFADTPIGEKSLSLVLGFFVPSGFRAQRRPWHDRWHTDRRKRSRFWRQCEINFLRRFNGNRRDAPPPPGFCYRRPFTRNLRNPMFVKNPVEVAFDTRKRYTFLAFMSRSGFREKRFHFDFPNDRVLTRTVRPVVLQAPTADVTSLLYSLLSALSI